MGHLDVNSILTDAQHGFRKKPSTESQLILTINDLASGLARVEQLGVILLDFSKAFDKVPSRLLSKLKYYGVTRHTLHWIAKFLSKRTQQVVLDGSRSGPADVLSSTQGMVLRPLLFLVYINDLPATVTSKQPTTIQYR